MIRIVYIVLLMVAVSACELVDTGGSNNDVNVVVPPGFELLPVPVQNALTIEKVELGRRLFFDPILSSDRTVSCASCHQPDRAFADSAPMSSGVGGRSGLRNSPSLVNVAYVRDLFWDGGAFTLEDQMLAPIQDPNEMNSELREVLDRLSSDASYRDEFKRVFGQGPSIATLTQAIAAYERTIVSGGSRYDGFAGGDTTALSAVERLGLQLFTGRAGCAGCHSGVRFTSGDFVNNGLLHTSADSGRARITLEPEDAGLFRVPSLRNVARTAPYMHDGRFDSLEDVVAHYSHGGVSESNRDPRVHQLSLTTAERDAIVAFLGSLTDTEIHEGIR